MKTVPRWTRPALAEANRCLHCACYAVSPSDITPVLVIADAQIVTTERTLSAGELAMKDAFPMAKNEYKLFMAKDVLYEAIMRFAR